MNSKRIVSKKTYWIIGIIALAIVVYLYFGRSVAPSQETAIVTKRTITQEVSATGNVKPVNSVDLGFETSGRVEFINAKVGDFISAGRVIASLNTAELNAQLDKAGADLASQKTALDKTNIDLNNYYGNIVNTINGAYTSANDAIRIKIDPLFSDDESGSPKLTFDSTNSQEKTFSESQRLIMKNMLNQWLLQINSLEMSSPQDSLEQVLSDSKTNLNKAYGFLNLLMNTTISAISLPVSTLVAYKTNINDARSEIDSAAAKITTLIQNISSQKATIASKQADIKSYEASVNNIKAQIAKTFLTSPISGTVTKQDAKVGEIVSANSVIASVISSGSYEIDSNIPEVDIARIKAGDISKVTLDAYGNDVVFEARVVSIDPAEIVIEGVSTYLTKFHFTKYDSRIKPGMTANIDIISASHDNALSLPQRAVQKQGRKEFVLVPKVSAKGAASATEEKIVATGLRGSDGYVEILSGLSEGEEVVIPRLGK